MKALHNLNFKQFLKNFIILIATVVTPLISFALPAPSQAIQEVSFNKTQFLFKGILFGFSSLESCVFKTDTALVIKNYCESKEVIPARSFYVLSPTLGYHYFYEELEESGIKREVTLMNSPKIVSEKWKPLDEINLDTLNEMLENLYYSLDEACWLNGYETENFIPNGGCLQSPLENYPEWNSSTAELIYNTNLWENSFQKLNEVTKVYKQIRK